MNKNQQLKVEVVGDTKPTTKLFKNECEKSTEESNKYEVIELCKNLLDKSKDKYTIDIVKDSIITGGIGCIRSDMFDYYHSMKFDYSKELEDINKYARKQLGLFVDMLFNNRSQDAVDLVRWNIDNYIHHIIPYNKQHWLISGKELYEFLNEAYKVL